MTDVSCRAFSWFEACARRGLISLDELLEGSAIPRATLQQKTARVPWDDWAKLCDRFAVLVGGDAEVGATGDIVLDSDLAGPLVPLARTLADPVDIYRVGFRFVGPVTYRNVAFELDRLGGRELRVSITIPPPHRPCRAWMLIGEATLRAIPRFMGLPDAVVIREVLDERRLVARVLPPPSRSVFHRLGLRLAGMANHDAMVRELELQQQQLAESWRALDRSERGFRAALEALPAGVAIHHRANVRLANPALRSMLGMEANELEARDLAELADPRDRPIWRAILEGVDGRQAVRLVRKDGRPLDVLARGVANVPFDGRPAGLVLVVDRSEEVRALHEVERSERLIHALHEALPDLVLRLDGNVLVDVHAGREHPEAMQLLGPLVGSDLIDVIRHFAEAIKNTETAAMFATLERAQRERTPAVVRFGVDVTGPVQLEARFMPLPEGEAVILVRDVTELIRLQEQLTLSARMTSVGTLAAGVAHEVNNPLTYVESNLELAIEELSIKGAPDERAIVAGLKEALEGTRRVGQIVRQLGDLSRPLAPEPRRVDLADAATRALSLAGNELRHRARVEQRFGVAPAAWADPQQVVQVMVNLLINAAQAIEPGNVAAHRIVVEIDTDGEGRPRVRISDTGAGMTPDVRARMFDPFFTTKPGSGSGLGLSISQRLVTAAGGALAVDSEPGRGSTMTLVLPAAAERSEPEAEKRPTPPLRRSRILIVDDDPPVGRALVRSLGDHDASWVPSVDAALAAVSGNAPDLVICDVMMPDRSGLDFFEAACASRPELRDRIVFLSGGVFVPGDEARVRESGCPIWSKPISPDELRRRVAEQLGARQ